MNEMVKARSGIAAPPKVMQNILFTGLKHMRNWREEPGTMPQAYCLKCRDKVEIKNPQKITMRNRRPAIRGTCTTCGIQVFKIGK